MIINRRLQKGIVACGLFALFSLTNTFINGIVFRVIKVEVRCSSVTCVQAVAGRCVSERGGCRRTRGARVSGLAENICPVVTE